jgi:hypothetical protein
MSSNDIHGIDKGWSVKTADGQDIGSVEETTHAYILVKSGLIGTAQRYLPSATLAHVRPEKREIGIALTKDEVESGDWSEPPTELPRTEGAPLNTGERDEVDPIAAGTVRDPEHPTSL